MAVTTPMDVILPTHVEGYIMVESAVRNAFIRSGIQKTDARISAAVARGGRVCELPYWNDLGGPRQVISTAMPLGTNRLTAGAVKGLMINDAGVWGFQDLVPLMITEDPAAALVSMTGQWQATVDQRATLAMLAGCLACPGGATQILDIAQDGVVPAIADSCCLTGSTFVDATHLLGDKAPKLTKICMHSDVEADLRKRDLLDTIPGSEGKAAISVFQGREVIVDDGMPKIDGTVEEGQTAAKIYDTYLFGAGAIGFGHEALSGYPAKGGHGTLACEFQRDGLAGDTVMIIRQRYIRTLWGFSFKGEEGLVPTEGGLLDDELVNPDNWERKWAPKQIGLVCLRHNIKP